MKVIVRILLAAFFLFFAAGCGVSEKPAESILNAVSSMESAAPAQNFEAQSSEPDPGALSYPIDSECGVPTWLQKGELLAVPDGYAVRLVDGENRLVREIPLQDGEMTRRYVAEISDYGIWGVNVETDRQPFMVVETEKGWEIRNAVLWDLNGRTVKMFPKETFSDSAVTACCVTWISEDLLAFNTQYMVFIYCISADTLTLADDMRLIQAEMDRSMLPYMGMSEEPDGAFGGKYYYFPHKNPQFSNVKGAVWEAGEDGSRALFGGLEFNRFAMSGNLMAMTVEKDDRASLYYAFTNDPEPRYIGEISSSYSLQVNGSRVSWLEETADSQSFGCFDTDTKTAGAVSFDQWRQLVFYGTRPSGGSLEFLFTEWKDGSDNLYSCDLLTDTRTLLYEDIHIYTNSQPSPDMTKFYTYTGTGDSDSAIRVISIE